MLHKCFFYRENWRAAQKENSQKAQLDFFCPSFANLCMKEGQKFRAPRSLFTYEFPTVNKAAELREPSGQTVCPLYLTISSPTCTLPQGALRLKGRWWREQGHRERVLPLQIPNTVFFQGQTQETSHSADKATSKLKLLSGWLGCGVLGWGWGWGWWLGTDGPLSCLRFVLWMGAV